MKSFKSFLTIILLTGLICGAAQAAEPTKIPAELQVKQTPTPDPVRAIDGSRLIEPGPAAGLEYIGYAWPYDDLDMQKVIDKPVVVELFSTQGCMFCPVADRLFTDLRNRVPNVIGLSCHVDYI